MKRTAVRLFAVVVILTLAVASGVAVWLHRSLFGVRSQEAVAVEIPAGQSARQILSGLRLDGLVPSPLAGRIYIRARAEGRNLHYGQYVFESNIRPVDVLERILDGNVEMFEVTVVEGSDTDQIREQLVNLGVGSVEEWRQVQTRVDWVAAVVPNATTLDGFLFPDTYRFAVGIPAPIAAQHMVDRFIEVWNQERPLVEGLWGSPLEVVTMASLVEAETSLAAERGLVAGVFANRLRRGMLLQCDPTVVYALKRRGEWKGRLYRIHWELDDPYNTYKYPGLPPGPINSPGRASLIAAMAPESTPYLYFVAKPGGGHTFSRTLTEHNRAVARLRAARR